jgi:hypothetical protein
MEPETPVALKPGFCREGYRGHLTAASVNKQGAPLIIGVTNPIIESLIFHTDVQFISTARWDMNI